MSALRILVAEDNMINQKIVQRTLQKHPVEIVMVANGKEAIDALQQQAFDVVLMDMQMPVMDGYEACIFIRSELRSDIPIIALTASSMPGEADSCIEAGASSYIAKPFDHNTLYQQILQMIGKEGNTGDDAGGTSEEGGLVDFSYVEELAGDKQDYIQQVLEIFMENTPSGLRELQQLIDETEDWGKMSSQAHFLKSSVGIVKIQGMHEGLQEIETLAREQPDKVKLQGIIKRLSETFQKAEPIIRAKMNKIA